jgi:hypothetical protein
MPDIEHSHDEAKNKPINPVSGNTWFYYALLIGGFIFLLLQFLLPLLLQ